jgi:hypothetical protein
MYEQININNKKKSKKEINKEIKVIIELGTVLFIFERNFNIIYYIRFILLIWYILSYIQSMDT